MDENGPRSNSLFTIVGRSSRTVNIDWHQHLTCCSKWAMCAQSRAYFSSCIGVLRRIPRSVSIRYRCLTNQVWFRKMNPMAIGATRSNRTMMITSELINVSTDGLMNEMSLEDVHDRSFFVSLKPSNVDYR